MRKRRTWRRRSKRPRLWWMWETKASSRMATRWRTSKTSTLNLAPHIRKQRHDCECRTRRASTRTNRSPHTLHPPAREPPRVPDFS
eukprot:13067_6